MRGADKHITDCLRAMAGCGPAPAHACAACEEFLVRERLAPMAFIATDGLPRTGAAARAYKSALGAQMVYQQVFQDIEAAFAAHGVAVVPLKGLYLCEKIYPAPGARPMSDLDLLVPRAQFAEAARILRKLGFGCDLDFLEPRNLPSGATFRHAAKSVAVDLHFSLLNGQGIRGLLLTPGQARRLDELAMSSAAREPYLDRDIAALSRPVLLLSLMLHHYTHNFSGLLWFLDAILVSRAMATQHWQEFESLIKEYGLEAAAGLWLRLAAVNFHCPESAFLPEGMQSVCRGAERARPVFGAAVRRGRLSPLSALALVPGPARRARAVMRAALPSRAYLEEISHSPIHGPADYLKQLAVFHKRLLLR